MIMTKEDIEKKIEEIKLAISKKNKLMQFLLKQNQMLMVVMIW